MSPCRLKHIMSRYDRALSRALLSSGSSGGGRAVVVVGGAVVVVVGTSVVVGAAVVFGASVMAGALVVGVSVVSDSRVARLTPVASSAQAPPASTVAASTAGMMNRVSFMVSALEGSRWLAVICDLQLGQRLDSPGQVGRVWAS